VSSATDGFVVVSEDDVLVELHNGNVHADFGHAKNVIAARTAVRQASSARCGLSFRLSRSWFEMRSISSSMFSRVLARASAHLSCGATHSLLHPVMHDHNAIGYKSDAPLPHSRGGARPPTGTDLTPVPSPSR
jgi:hypothetical protein